MLPVSPSESGDTNAQLICDQIDCLLHEQAIPGLIHPATRTRWVRQRNDDRPSSNVVDDVLGADQLRERQRRKESLDRQPADGYEQFWPDDSELTLEPVAAARLLLPGRHAITASARVWSGITTSYGRDVDRFSRRSLVDPRPSEPAKKCFARSAREWPAALALNFSGRLADQHCARIGRARDHRSYVRSEPTSLASAERCHVLSEGQRFPGRAHYPHDTRAGIERSSVVRSNPYFSGCSAGKPAPTVRRGDLPG